MFKRIIIIVDKNKIISAFMRKIYDITLGKYLAYKRNQNFSQYGKEALFQIDKAFGEIGIDYWLEFGTMLGAVREKNFIDHDVDIDLGCFSSSYNKKYEKIFNKYGLIKIQEILVDDGKYSREETYRYKNIDIDIFYFYQDNHEIYCHDYTKIEGKTWISTIEKLGGLLVREIRFPYDGLREIEFLEKKFNIPSNIDKHLSIYYGKNFMIKDPNYSKSTATNVRMIHNKIAKLYQYNTN